MRGGGGGEEDYKTWRDVVVVATYLILASKSEMSEDAISKVKMLERKLRFTSTI